MKKNLMFNYTSPKIEVQTFEIERGFALSNMEPIEMEKPEQNW